MDKISWLLIIWELILLWSQKKEVVNLMSWSDQALWNLVYAIFFHSSPLAFLSASGKQKGTSLPKHADEKFPKHTIHIHTRIRWRDKTKLSIVKRVWIMKIKPFHKLWSRLNTGCWWDLYFDIPLRNLSPMTEHMVNQLGLYIIVY